MSDNEFHNNISRELGGIQKSLQSQMATLEALVEQVKIANHRTAKAEARIKTLEDWKKMIQPVTDLTSIGNGLKAIAKWLGIPFIAFLGYLLAKFKGLL